MRVRQILDPQHIVLDVTGSTKEEILRKLSRPIADSHPSIDHDTLLEVLVKREETSTTAIADGIAIPHGKLAIGEQVICGFGRSRKGVDFDSVDGNPTHIFFLLVSPESHPSLHLRWLAHLAVMLKSPDFRHQLVEAETAEDILATLDHAEEALDNKEASARGS